MNKTRFMPLLFLLIIILIIVFLIYRQTPQEHLPMVDIHTPLPVGNTANTSSVEGVFYVDVRTPEEFAGGSVLGAVNIPFDEVSSRIGEFKNKEKVVVFCRSGNRAGQAKSILDKAGIQNVVNGGSWQEVAKNIK
jgi:rhodanese-related sulfurtransferase